jgi:hypothetical protein
MGNTTDKIAGVANQAAGKVKGGGVVSSARLTSVHFILNSSGRRSRPSRAAESPTDRQAAAWWRRLRTRSYWFAPRRAGLPLHERSYVGRQVLLERCFKGSLYGIFATLIQPASAS